jgi:hypothetical protein
MYIRASVLLVAAAVLILCTWPEPKLSAAKPLVRSAVPCSDLDAAQTDAIAAVKEQIENKHPATYLILAQRLSATGAKDEAIFWFHVGLIRYRGYLAGEAGAGEAAQFRALAAALERPIKDHAFGDVPALAAAIGRALAWDERHANPYVPRGGNERVRSALRRMRLELLARRVPRCAHPSE